MTSPDRKQLIRDAYRAYETRDREALERLLADDFVFYAPRTRESTARPTGSAAGRTPRRSSGSSSCA